MIDAIDNVVNAISGVLYQPYVVPLILVLAGLYFTFRLKGIQFNLFGESIRVVSEKPVNLESTSSFGALMVSTASRVGTGNIMGVSTAICVGGPGAIFWMWVTAVLGGASAFVESTLAQIYKKRNPDGSSYGGPSYYIQEALRQRWLGVIFAVVLILTYAVGYNMLAAYNTQDTFSSFSFYGRTTSIVVGAVLAVLFAASVLGGAKRLTKVTEVLVPLMGVLYIVVSLVVIVMNIKSFGAVFGSIFRSAFDFKAIFGGFGPIFMAVAVCLFAFTTLIGNYYYTEGCWRFILKKDPGKGFMTGWRLFCSLLVFVGAVISAGLAWDTADLLQALMVIINVPVIVILGRTAVRALDDYRAQRKAGRNPTFHAKDIGVSGTDFWN